MKNIKMHPPGWENIEIDFQTYFNIKGSEYVDL